MEHPSSKETTKFLPDQAQTSTADPTTPIEMHKGLEAMTTLDTHLPYLPEDIILYSILTRLPVKSLFRFRCVSTLWNATLSHSDFNNLHLSIGLQNRSSSILGLFHYETEDPKIFRYDFLTKDDPYFFCLQADKNTRLIGHDNGLFCLLTNRYIIILNPCTSEFLGHPLPPRPSAKHPISYGFGFDHLTKEYKAVQLVHGYRKFCRCMVYTFGAEENSWRVIANEVNLSDHYNWVKLPDGLPTGGTIDSGTALLVNGTLFWFFRHIHLLMAFDLHSETFTFFEGPRPEPDLCNFFQTARCKLIEWQGCICLAFQSVVGNIVHLYKYDPSLPNRDLDGWHFKKVDVQADLVPRAGAGSLGGESVLYSFQRGNLFLYAEGADGRFYNLRESELEKRFPLLVGVHRRSVIQHQFIYHVENCMALKTLWRSDPTRLHYAPKPMLELPE